jgi:hypothetical protein
MKNILLILGVFLSALWFAFGIVSVMFWHTYFGLWGFCFAPIVFILCLEGVKNL